ncbi:MAG TPA: GTP cyclohydrolase FolE2 [Bacillota bacterium]|jgi:GTP cyclohydrolase I|nr:GTP cyclohydrolase FolE2 [Bacillota bacterium]HOL10841.1 GTP cyclohydrolase FolE2 [Bacillota bacterium]HPO98568.1 GTP cyclohydrolase FolE2 [Bacillota bacterium]
MIDVQNMTDLRGIEIKRVGLKDVNFPFQIKMKNSEFQHVQGNVTIAVSLPHHYKGTHLSRFMELLMWWTDKPISCKEIKQLLTQLCSNLNVIEAEISLKFRYFLPVPAPVSKIIGYLDYLAEFKGFYKQPQNEFFYQLGVEIPVQSLCPCSKEISQFGAHNQRAIIRSLINFDYPGKILWLEDLIELLRNQGSCPVYPVLKREDEKYVTETAYQNPKFVEDILRDSVLALRSDPRINHFQVEVESYESIHNHSAFASHVEART